MVSLPQMERPKLERITLPSLPLNSISSAEDPFSELSYLCLYFSLSLSPFLFWPLSFLFTALQFNSITSSDPLAYPTIDANYYSNPYDVDVATAGTGYLRQIAASPEYSAYIEKETVPGAQVTDLQTYTTTIGFTTEYHHLGSASMLPRDQGGVVDNTLKVYGTTNVRVCDASIIPLHISAHIQATVYGIAEALFDIINGKFQF